MKLELKHLAPYLPYELKILNGKEYDIVNGIDNKTVISLFRGHLENFTTIENVKPILRPLSDLISLINIDFEDEKFKPIDVIIRKGGCHSAVALHVKIGRGTLGFKYFDLLLQWHFDVFGLIDAGLAIDINTL